MKYRASMLLEVEFGVASTVVPRAANVTLSRIGPAPRRPAGRVSVRWTLEKGAPFCGQVRATQLA